AVESRKDPAVCERTLTPALSRSTGRGSKKAASRERRFSLPLAPCLLPLAPCPLPLAPCPLPLQIHDRKPHRVPHLVAEVPPVVELRRGVLPRRRIPLDRHSHVLRVGGHGAERVAHGVRAVRVDDVQRID